MFEQREPSFKAIQEIVRERQAVKFRFKLPGSQKRKAVIVDYYTATAIVAVHEAADDKNKAKVERMVASSLGSFMTISEFAIHARHRSRAAEAQELSTETRIV